MVGKHRGVLLRRGFRGGDDDASAGRQGLEERRRRLGRVDDDQPARHAGEHGRPVGRGEIGAHQVELRLLPVEGAVAEQHDDHEVVLPHLAAKGGERLPHVLGRGDGAGLARGLVDELHDLRGREAETARQRRLDALPPGGELRRVVGAARGAADHHRPARIARRRRRRGRLRRGRRGQRPQPSGEYPVASCHASPTRRRHVHSMASSAITASRLHTPCHRSRTSGGPSTTAGVASFGGIADTPSGRT